MEHDVKKDALIDELVARFNDLHPQLDAYQFALKALFHGLAQQDLEAARTCVQRLSDDREHASKPTTRHIDEVVREWRQVVEELDAPRH